MADGHPARQSERLGPLCDQGEREQPELAAFMQVDVDWLAMPVRQPEDDIEVPHRITIDARGVKPADKIGARVQGRIEQFLRAR